jgi:hypothetical protein
MHAKLAVKPNWPILSLMPRTGRPRKSTAERREELLVIRLIPKEKQELQAAADAETGGDLSAWARNLLLVAARKTRLVD